MNTVMMTGYSNTYQTAMDVSKKYNDKKKEACTSITEEPEEESSLKLQEKNEKEKTHHIPEEEEAQLKAMEDFIARMQEAVASIKNAFKDSGKKTLYDATMDLMLIANAEKEPALRSIYARLLFKSKAVRASGADADQIRAALRKINKVIGKTKTKIKKLKKEELIEKKRKKAEAEKRRKMAEELQRELERKKKIRKNRERQDVEESKMGMGANYGGESSKISPAPDVSTGAGMIAGESADVLSQIEGVDMSPVSVSSECAASTATASIGSAVDVFL